METTTLKQVKQLKLNVTNIHSFLVKKNKQDKKLQTKEKDKEKRKVSIKKAKEKEKKLEIKSSPLGKISENTKDSITSGGSILDKILNFGGLLLAGILVNSLPALAERLKIVAESVISFVTPVVDVFKILIESVGGGDPSPELEPAKIKLLSDIEDKKDGILTELRNILGPFNGIVDLLEPLIDDLMKKFGNKLNISTSNTKLVKNEKGEEGIQAPGQEFVKTKWTKKQRERYDKGDDRAYIMPDAEDLTGLNSSSTIIDQKNLPKLPPTGHIAGQKYGAPRDDDGDGIPDRRHAGQDFDAGLNDTFYSRIGGVVMRQYETSGGYGNYVDIYNKDLNVTERIAEGDITLVNTGDKITPGTPVQRGTAQTGVFHYEIRNGKEETYGFEGTRDPIKFLNDLAKKAKISSAKKAKISSANNENQVQQVSSINQPIDDESDLLVVIQPVNTVHAVPYMMPFPVASKGSSSASTPQLSALWSA